MFPELYIKISFPDSIVSSFKLTANGLGLCDGGELEAQMFNLAQMFI